MKLIHPVAIAAGNQPDGAGARFLAPLRAVSSDGNYEISIDVIVRDGLYQVWANLPGVARADVAIGIDGDTVRIDVIPAPVAGLSLASGSLRMAWSDGPGGAVSRVFKLPATLDEQGATAMFGSGVLIVELPMRTPTALPTRPSSAASRWTRDVPSPAAGRARDVDATRIQGSVR